MIVGYVATFFTDAKWSIASFIAFLFILLALQTWDVVGGVLHGLLKLFVNGRNRQPEKNRSSAYESISHSEIKTTVAQPAATDNDPQLPVFDWLYAIILGWYSVRIASDLRRWAKKK